MSDLAPNQAHRKIIIMGGTSGIGLATAIQLQQDGAEVWALGRSVETIKKVEQNYPDIHFQAIDTHDTDTLKHFLERFSEQHGEIDHLVSAATGANRTMAPFMQQSDEQFREAFNKFWGYCNIVRQCVPYLKPKGSITLVSGTPARKCMPGMSAVSCVGAAVEALTRALAAELAPIRINVVAPGMIDTAMHDGFGENKAAIFEQLSQNILLKRVGQAEEVASAIVLTLTNNFMTGATIDVDGGQLLP